MPVAFFTRTRTGALVSRLNNDVIGAQRAFSDTLSGVVSNIVTLLLTLAVMLEPVVADHPAGAGAAAGVRAARPPDGPPARRVCGARRADHNAADEHPDDRALLRAGRDPGQAVRAARPTSPRNSPRGPGGCATSASAPRWCSRYFVTALTLVSALALALVYGLGGFFALRGQLEAGAVVSLALLLTRLYAPLTALASARVEVMSALVSFERVFEVLDLEAADHREAGRPPRCPTGRSRWSSTPSASATRPPTRSRSPRWRRSPPSTPAAASRCCTTSPSAPKPGQMVALVGSSGAGKSTIAQLLPRLYDADAGAVRLAGVDVRDLTADSIRDTLGMVTQDGHLFHDSIRANLLLAKPEATEEELWDALRRARLSELIASLPDGLDTVVGERGYRLSGGERQRLTIARLLLAHPRVVILDEATAHLDSTSEAAVQEALAEALAGRTALVIAHRLSTVRAADLILVVEDGRIVERGTHRDAARRRRALRELYRTQFSATDSDAGPGQESAAGTAPTAHGSDPDSGPEQVKETALVP